MLDMAIFTSYLGGGFAFGVLIWFTGYGIAASVEALKAASSIGEEE